MRVAIVGSRDYPDEAQVRAFVRALGYKHPDVTIVSGKAPGVDTWAEWEAKRWVLAFKGWPITKGVYSPKVAPLMRNTQIVADSDIIIAFQHNASSGTADTIRKARAAGKPVHVYGPDDAGKESIP